MYDYIIVGAGSAGCVLAHRLSAEPDARVLLLEGGPDDRPKEVKIPAAFPKLFKTERDWDYATEPEPHLDGRALYWPRGRMLGGSSSMNAQIYIRGNRLDYDRWAELGNEGWGWDDVLPYFKRAEHNERGPSRHHGTGGPLNVADLRDPSPLSRAFVQAGIEAGLAANPDFNGDEQDGVGPSQVTQRKGTRWSTATGYLKPARRRPNLTVMTGAHATRVLFDGRRATGVEYRRDGGVETAEARREVILSGGAVNSPQLLMLSGIGPAAELQAHGIDVVHDLPGVGQNLQDHLSVTVLATCHQPLSLLAAESLGNVARFLVLKKGMLTSNVGEAGAFVRTATGLEAPDIQFLFAPVLYINHGLAAPPEHGFTVGVILLTPKSTGTVTLSSADPLAAPRITANYLSDAAGDDLRVLVEGVRLARRVIRSHAFDQYRKAELAPTADVDSDSELAMFVRGIAETLYHPVGTCSMGIDAAAVVDPQLRVRGLDGLRVVDASVMPVIPRGNTNAPTIMIGEKAADLIRTTSHRPPRAAPDQAAPHQVTVTTTD